MPQLTLLKSIVDLESPESRRTFSYLLNDTYDRINDYHRDAEMTGLAVYIGPNGFATEDDRITTLTADTTLNATHKYVFVDPSSGNRTITLPPVATSSGYVYVLKQIVNFINTVTIDGNASEIIDGMTTQTLLYGMTIVCDGATWHRI